MSLHCLSSSTRIILIYIKTKIMRCNIMYYASVRPCVVFLEIIIFMVSCMLYTNTRAHGAITSCSNSHFLLANCEYFDSLKGVDFLSDFFLVYYVMYVQKTKVTDCSLDILFLSNPNIHKSWFGLCFWALDPLIHRC